MAPISAAHILVSDTPPEHWEETLGKLRLDAVDSLFISPFIVQKDGTGKFKFVLENEDTKNGARVTAVVQKARAAARAAKRSVTIFAQQWYGEHSGIDQLRGQNDEENKAIRAAYVDSVPDVLVKYDLDGWDLDYEAWGGRPGVPATLGNLVPWAPKLIHDVHQRLKKLSTEKSHRYYVSLSPATPIFLSPDVVDTGFERKPNPAAKAFPVNKSVDYVSVQTYAGGRNSNNGIDIWAQNLGFPSNRLLYGLVSEENQGKENKREQHPTFKEARTGYENQGKKLAGIHVWRLNGNTDFSKEVLPVMYNWLHEGDTSRPVLEILPEKGSKTNLTIHDIDNMWDAKTF